MTVTDINKCSTCFYAEVDKDTSFPCKICDNYNKWVARDIYIKQPDFKPLAESIRNWDFDDAFDNAVKQTLDHDPVSKPRHYMLFPEKDIEVRDVIEKLVQKISLETYSGMFVADYVQMMQYLMRFMNKNGVEDLKKARWYLDKMIDVFDEPDYIP